MRGKPRERGSENLSPLENAQQGNTTLETLRRVVQALGKELVLAFHDTAARAG